MLTYGFWGLFAGTFLAATVVPFASDALVIAMLAMGADAFKTVWVATLGNWLGGLTTYWIGWAGRWEWIEKWFHVSREKVESHREKVSRHGHWLALLVWVPGVGDILAVALGFYRVRFWRSALLMLVGKCARFVVWAWLYGVIF